MTDQDYLTRCVVDPMAKKFYLYSSEGNEKTIDCDTSEQFMDVLEMVKILLDDSDCLAYTNPLI
jgi:hypothetical protein